MSDLSEKSELGWFLSELASLSDYTTKMIPKSEFDQEIRRPAEFLPPSPKQETQLELCSLGSLSASQVNKSSKSNLKVLPLISC